jgi:hypothetical protein
MCEVEVVSGWRAHGASRPCSIEDERSVRPERFDPKKGFPVGPQLHYRCTTCDVVLPSQPANGVSCRCGNIFIDVGYARIAVDRVQDMELLESSAAEGSDGGRRRQASARRGSTVARRMWRWIERLLGR